MPKLPDMAQMKSVVEKTQKMHETVLFPRWKDVPEVHQAVENLRALAKKYAKLRSTGKSEDISAAQKVWVSMTGAWWSTLLALIDAMTEPVNGALPKQLEFDETERLFIDFGIIADGTLPFHNDFDPEAALAMRSEGGVFPCMSFSDYIAYYWSTIISAPAPAPAAGPAASALMDVISIELNRAQGERDELMLDITHQHAPNVPVDMEALTSEMNKCLMTAMKVVMRMPEYRDAPEKVRQRMAQDRAAYFEAEKTMLLTLSTANKNEENPLLQPDWEHAIEVHERTKILAKKILYCEASEKKMARRAQKTAANAGATVTGKRAELKTMLTKKREYLTVPGKTARCDTGPFAPSSDLPIDFRAGAAALEEMCSSDIEMLNVARVRMYGVPQVIFVPAQGLGTYDWSDHTLLIPIYPVGGSAAADSASKAVAYALAAFRWDSDEDRHLKNPYEQIKENRKKSLIAMATSFYKDYSTWMTKERKGYRLLPRETHKVFLQMLKPKPEEN